MGSFAPFRPDGLEQRVRRVILYAHWISWRACLRRVSLVAGCLDKGAARKIQQTKRGRLANVQHVLDFCRCAVAGSLRIGLSFLVD